MVLKIRFIVALAFLTSYSNLFSAEPTYDPLSIPVERKSQPHDLKIEDSSRRREIPIRVFLPESSNPAPVVIFSHGLGGSREGNPYLGQHWSNRGYVVVFVQHLGSDASVWKDEAPANRLASLKKAANIQNSLLRFKDIPATIDQLEKWNRSTDSILYGRLDTSRIGMSGHSFGAVTTQAVSGQKTPLGTAAFTDQRIKAAVIMSPSSPKNAADPKRLFGSVSIPWLLMTGTNDIAMVGDTDMESRLAVFPALSPGNKYELVLKDGTHEAFSDHLLPNAAKRRNPNHHRVILGLSTAFWDAFLREDKQAIDWLNGSGPSTIIEAGDRWQSK